MDDRGDEWTVVLGPGPGVTVREQLTHWRRDHPEVAEDDIRVDLIRDQIGMNCESASATRRSDELAGRL